MTTVMIAVVVLAVLGAIFGLVLAIASKVFAVEVDPREEAIPVSYTHLRAHET